MAPALTTEELIAAGLLDLSTTPHLSETAHDWLHALDEVGYSLPLDMTESRADLVLSTNGVFR